MRTHTPCRDIKRQVFRLAAACVCVGQQSYTTFVRICRSPRPRVGNKCERIWRVCEPLPLFVGKRSEKKISKKFQFNYSFLKIRAVNTSRRLGRFYLLCLDCLLCPTNSFSSPFILLFVIITSPLASIRTRVDDVITTPQSHS